MRNPLAKLWNFFRSRGSSSFFTVEEGRKIAAKYKLVSEYEEALRFGLNPDEALEEWDMFPFGEEAKVKKSLQN